MDKAKEINTLIFDFGGVLYKINPEKTYQEFLSKARCPEKLSDISSFYKTNDIFADYETGRISSKEFRKAAVKAMCLDLSGDEEFDRIWNYTLTGLFPDTIERLKRFRKDYRLLLLSNTNEIHYNYFKNQCRELFSLFDKKYLSYRIGKRKPNPEIFEYVLMDSGLKPEECLFIDDTQANTEAASKLGINTFLYEGINGTGVLEEYIINFSVSKENT